MDKNQFIKEHLFRDIPLENSKDENLLNHQFSEEEFELILERAKHFGVGVFTIETFFKGTKYASTTHDDLKKKATDYNWYQRAFKTFRKKQSGLKYTATYKVSPKLLAKEAYVADEEE